MHGKILQALKNDAGDTKETLEQKLYAFFGRDCLHHLFRVASGLDSAVVAETEIQGQVKLAYEEACRYQRLPYELHFLFQKGLKAGKMIRSQFKTVRGMPALEQAIFQAGEHLFSDPASRSLLFVGVSEINCKILSHLKRQGMGNIHFCNRSENKLQTMVNKFGVSTLSWKDMGKWPAFDWVIFGTRAKHFLAGPNDLSSSLTSQKLIIDLSVPRNVDPKLGRNPGVVLLNIDQINRMLKFRKKQVQQTLDMCETLVDEASIRQMQVFEGKLVKKEALLAPPSFALTF